MPYRSNNALPAGVKNHLPPHAQDIYRAAFNNAWEEYEDPANRTRGGTREDAARRVAWAAVKKKYRKDGETWKEKEA